MLEPGPRLEQQGSWSDFRWPLTGKEAAWGQSSHSGTLLAIEEINAQGGVLGKQLKRTKDQKR